VKLHFSIKISSSIYFQKFWLETLLYNYLCNLNIFIKNKSTLNFVINVLNARLIAKRLMQLQQKYKFHSPSCGLLSPARLHVLSRKTIESYLHDISKRVLELAFNSGMQHFYRYGLQFPGTWTRRHGFIAFIERFVWNYRYVRLSCIVDELAIEICIPNRNVNIGEKSNILFL